MPICSIREASVKAAMPPKPMPTKRPVAKAPQGCRRRRGRPRRTSESSSFSFLRSSAAQVAEDAGHEADEDGGQRADEAGGRRDADQAGHRARGPRR